LFLVHLLASAAADDDVRRTRQCYYTDRTRYTITLYTKAPFRLEREREREKERLSHSLVVSVTRFSWLIRPVNSPVYRPARPHSSDRYFVCIFHASSFVIYSFTSRHNKHRWHHCPIYLRYLPKIKILQSLSLRNVFTI